MTANESCVTASSGRRISVTFGVNISMVKTPGNAGFIVQMNDLPGNSGASRPLSH